MSRSRATACSLLLLAVGAAGCFGGHRREYPSDWPRRVERHGDACPDLSGAFETSQVPDPLAPGLRTFQELLPNKLPGGGPSVRLLLDASSGPLGVTTYSDDGTPLMATRLERGLDFECSGGGLEITFPMLVGNANVCALAARQQVALFRDAEGGLVARASNQQTCVGGIFGSIHLWSADWLRFRPVPPPPGGTWVPPELGPEPKPRQGKTVSSRLAGLAVMEVLFAGHSWWASASPEFVGQLTVLVSPAGVIYDSGAAWTPPAIAMGGAVGVGVYDAAELSKPGYSKNDRFVRTFAAWNAVALTTVISDWIIGGPRPPGLPAVAVVPVDGGALLVLSGAH